MSSAAERGVLGEPDRPAQVGDAERQVAAEAAAQPGADRPRQRLARRAVERGVEGVDQPGPSGAGRLLDQEPVGGGDLAPSAPGPRAARRSPRRRRGSRSSSSASQPRTAGAPSSPSRRAASARKAGQLDGQLGRERLAVAGPSRQARLAAARTGRGRSPPPAVGPPARGRRARIGRRGPAARRTTPPACRRRRRPRAPAPTPPRRSCRRCCGTIGTTRPLRTPNQPSRRQIRGDVQRGAAPGSGSKAPAGAARSPARNARQASKSARVSPAIGPALRISSNDRVDRLLPGAGHPDELLADDIQRRRDRPQRLDPAGPSGPRRDRRADQLGGRRRQQQPARRRPPAMARPARPAARTARRRPAGPTWTVRSAVPMSTPSSRLVLVTTARTSPDFSPASIARRRWASSAEWCAAMTRSPWPAVRSGGWLRPSARSPSSDGARPRRACATRPLTSDDRSTGRCRATRRSCVIFSAKARVLAKTTVVRWPSMIRRRRRSRRR